MSKYLHRLLALDHEKRAGSLPSKPSKAPFEPFEGNEGSPFSRNRPVASALRDWVQEARLDWWVQPVAGWRDGKLTLHNFASGSVAEIDLRTGTVRRRDA